MENTCLMGIWDSTFLIKKIYIFFHLLACVPLFFLLLYLLPPTPNKSKQVHPPQFLEIERP